MKVFMLTNIKITLYHITICFPLHRTTSHFSGLFQRENINILDLYTSVSPFLVSMCCFLFLFVHFKHQTACWSSTVLRVFWLTKQCKQGHKVIFSAYTGRKHWTAKSQHAVWLDFTHSGYTVSAASVFVWSWCLYMAASLYEDLKMYGTFHMFKL